MNPWLLASRPKTLSAAVVPVLIGGALAPHIDWSIFAFALFGALFIQIGTNFVNDALDFKRGADTHERLGPVRVTQAGLLSANAVLLGAYASFGFAALCGIPLIVRGGWPILVIGVVSIIAATALNPGDYFAINTSPAVFASLGMHVANLPALEAAVKESVAGRTGATSAPPPGEAMVTRCPSSSMLPASGSTRP